MVLIKKYNRMDACLIFGVFKAHKPKSFVLPYTEVLIVLEVTSSLTVRHWGLTDSANDQYSFKRSLTGRGNIISIDLESTQGLLIRGLDKLKG